MNSTEARLVHTSELPSTAWKNGAGATTEIAAGPICGGRPLWRFSIAALTAGSTRFSSFPEIDRVFTVIGEHGVRLDFSTGSLDAEPSAPTSFRGEDVPVCTPGGDTAAFNVMVDRTRASAGVVVHDLSDGSLTIEGGAITAVYVLSGSARAGSIEMAAGHCLLAAGNTTSMAGDAQILVARITPNNAG